MTQSITIANAHSVLIDETNLHAKNLAVSVYDVHKNQLFNLIINTDTVSPGLVSTKVRAPKIQINGSAAPVTVAAGSTITAAVANGPGNPGDWLGVYAAGASNSDYGSFKWLSTDGDSSGVPATGVTSGAVHFVVPAAAGTYEVRFFPNNGWDVTARSAAITVSGAASAMPKTVLLTPSSANVPDSSPVGTSLSTIAVVMSDRSAFSGSLSIAANNMVGLSGGKAMLTRALATADDGAHSCVITAAQGGGSASAMLNLTVVGGPPPLRRLVLSLSPLPGQIDDASPAGMVLSTATVKYSDETVPASIILTSSDSSLVGINGVQVVLARALSAADDGVHHVTITASDGLGAAATMRLFEAGP